MTTRRKIKICRIQSRICVGGPAHQTLLLSGRLDPDRFETVLIGGAVEEGEEDLSRRAEDLGIRTIHLPEMHRSIRPFDDLRAFYHLCRIIRKERPDIVHTHTSKAGALGRLAARACGVPVVVHTFHGHVLHGYFPPPVNLLMGSAERVLAGLSDRLVALSTGQARELAERYRIASSRKFSVIPLGLDLDRFVRCAEKQGRLRRELGLEPAALLIGWVGRLVSVKDPFLFLETGAEIIKRGTQAHLLLAGGGPLRRAVAEKARHLGIADRTHLLGCRGGMEEIYADLDLLVGTSKSEGTPVAMIEAMAAGLPIVTVDVGGVRDLLRGYPSARIVGERAPEVLADAVEALVGRRPPRIDGSAVAVRFGAERLVGDIERLYRDLLEQKDTAPKDDRGDREDAAA
jgi:glycosyltransferase involved in cell wall biosynthesis